MAYSFKKENFSNEEEKLSGILTRVRATCWVKKFEGAAVGAFKENIFAREMGLWDKVQKDHTSKGEKIGNVEVSIVYPNEIE